MPTAKILHSNLNAVTYSLQNGSASAESPLENLLTWFPGDVLEFAAGGVDQALVIDMGSQLPLKSRNFCLIHTHNLDQVFPTSGSVLLQAATNTMFTTGLETVALLYAQLDAPLDDPILYVEFSGVAKRYWRIFASGSVVVPMKLGTVLIDSTFAFQFSYKWDYARENQQFATEVFTSLDGARQTASPTPGRLVYELEFPGQNTTFQENFATLYHQIQGRLSPFYLYDSSLIRLMKFDSDTIKVRQEGLPKNQVDTLVFKSVETKKSWYAEDVVIADGLSDDFIVMD